MTFAGALIIGVLLVGWCAPFALRRLAACHDAAVGIICWIVTIAGVLSTFAVGVGLLLLPGHQHTGPFAHLGHDCWTFVRHDWAHELGELLGAVGVSALATVLFRCVRASATSLRSRRRERGAHLELLGITELSGARGSNVVWLDHPAPFAYSLAGRPSLVVATTGLRELPEAQRDAVLRHEIAHVRGRHHLWVALTEDLAKALPFVPLFRHAPAATRQLVELAADAAAASACGRFAVRAALLALDGGTHPQQALAIASRDVPLRLRRLAQSDRTGGRLPRTAARVAAVLTSAVTPAVVGLGTFLVALAAACPAH
jgi:hypothetical protein